MTTVVERWLETPEGEIAVDITVEYALYRYRDEDDEVEIFSATTPDGAEVVLSAKEIQSVMHAASALDDVDPVEYEPDEDAWQIGQDAFERRYY